MDFGGWPDTRFFLEYDWGFLMNIALRLWTYVVIVQMRRPGDYSYYALDLKDPGMIHQREETFVHQALKALQEKLGPRERHIIVHSLAPPQTGVGTSGSVGVAVIAALDQLINGKSLTPEEIIYLSHYIEWKIMETETGIQDQIAACCGSRRIRCHAKKFPQFKDWPLRFLPEMRQKVEAKSFLVDTGENRSSTKEHERKIAMVERGGKERQNVLSSIRRIRNCGLSAATCFESGSWDNFLNCVDHIWEAQVMLDSSARTDRISQIEDKAKEMGAVIKWFGAGGGGIGGVFCLDKVDREKVEQEIDSLVRGMSGARIIPCLVSQTGVEVCSFTPDELEKIISRR
jgi:galactokinase/mevalonate kinase-like predicted kinase